MSVRWACGERERAVDHPRRSGQRAAAPPRRHAQHAAHQRRTLEARCLVVGLRASGRRQGDAELGEAVLDVHGPHERGAAGRPDRGEQRGWEAAAEHVCDDGRRRRRRASFSVGGGSRGLLCFFFSVQASNNQSVISEARGWCGGCSLPAPQACTHVMSVYPPTPTLALRPCLELLIDSVYCKLGVFVTLA